MFIEGAKRREAFALDCRRYNLAMNQIARLTLALAPLALLAVPGCVERKIVIGSSPPGALVTLNDVEVGRTPVKVPFTWYGDYDIRLRYERNVAGPDERPVIKRYYLHTHKKTTTPWFDVLGIDLVTELWPADFKDEQVWAFEIPEVVEPTDEELIQRARDLQEQLQGPRQR
jgi:hypothetical protein